MIKVREPVGGDYTSHNALPGTTYVCKKVFYKFVVSDHRLRWL